jgi:hypothetical protein
MDDAYSATKERTTSGHGGHINARVRDFAAKSDATEDEIKAEWEVLANCKELREEAKRIVKLKQMSAEKGKAFKDHELPKAIKDAACSSPQVSMHVIKDLQERNRKIQSSERAMKELGHARPLTKQEMEDQQALEELESTMGVPSSSDAVTPTIRKLHRSLEASTRRSGTLNKLKTPKVRTNFVNHKRSILSRGDLGVLEC